MSDVRRDQDPGTCRNALSANAIFCNGFTCNQGGRGSHPQRFLNGHERKGQCAQIFVARAPPVEHLAGLVAYASLNLWMQREKMQNPCQSVGGGVVSSKVKRQDFVAQLPIVCSAG